MSFLTKTAIDLLELLGDRNFLYSFLPILIEWYGVIAPYHHLLCCNVLVHDYFTENNIQTA